MRRLLLLSVVAGSLFLGWAGSSWAGDEAKTILDKAIQAHGGEAKLAAIKAIRTRSTGNSSRLISIQYQGAPRKVWTEVFTRDTSFFPDKFKVDQTTVPPGMVRERLITVLTKNKGSAHLFGTWRGSKGLQGSELDELKQQMHRQWITQLAPLRDKVYTLTPLLGEAKVQEKPVVGIRVKAQGFRDVDLFFDKETGRLTMIRYRGVNLEIGQEFTEEVVVTEYQQVDGVSVPKKIVVNRNGEKVEDEEFVEVQLLKTPDEKEGLQRLDLSETETSVQVPATDARLKELLKDLPELRELNLAGTKVTDAGLKELKELKKLQTLILAETKVTNAGLKELKDLSELRRLNLAETKVTDAGLKELKAFKGLQKLFLEKTKVTDAGLKELKDLPELRRLNLAKTKVTDAGLKELKELKKLQTLNLREAPVAGTGLKELKDLPELRLLNLRETKVTDAGLKGLKELQGLQTLILIQTAVTDTGLKELKGLKQLRHLKLNSTKVTDAGIADLKKALPQLRFEKPRFGGVFGIKSFWYMNVKFFGP